MKLSIITTVYKAEKDLPRLLDSMMALKSTELEFYMINNGSPDGCGEILTKYAKLDSRFKIHTLKENIGYIGARNLGIQQVEADYVGFCDSDDYLEPNGYDNALLELQSYLPDFYIACFNQVFSESRIKIVTPPYEFGLYVQDDVKGIISPQSFGPLDSNQASLSGFVWKHIYKLDVLRRNRLFFHKDIQPYEDEIFNIDVIKSSAKILVSKQVLYNYVVNESSITSKMRQQFNLEEEWDRVLSIYKLRQERWTSNNEIIASKNIIIDYIYGCMLWTGKCNNQPISKSSKTLKRLCEKDRSVLEDIYSDVNLNRLNFFIKTCLLNNHQAILIFLSRLYFSLTRTNRHKSTR